MNVSYISSDIWYHKNDFKAITTRAQLLAFLGGGGKCISAFVLCGLESFCGEYSWGTRLSRKGRSLEGLP